MKVDQFESIPKIVLGFILMWVLFIIGGFFHIFDWWGNPFASYLIVCIGGWIGFIANVGWLILTDKRMWHWSVRCAPIIVNLYLVYYFGDMFGLTEI